MDEPRPEDIEDYLDELEGEYGEQESLPPLMPATEKALQQRPGSGTSVGGMEGTPSPNETYAKILKETRSWGLWSLGLGVMHLILSGLSGS